MTRARDLLLHPIALLAIAVLVANDHVWKQSHPCWLTGKLSDAAGLAFFPLLVLVALERWIRPQTRALALSIVTTAVAFALVKTSPAASGAFGHVLGLAQWPVYAIAAAVHGEAIPGVVPAYVVTDPTDLLALPFVMVAAIVAWRRGFADYRGQGATLDHVV